MSDAAFWNEMRWLGPLGAGAQARVWALRHVPSGRPLAVRVLRTTARSWSDLRAEARLLVGMDHPNIVRVHDLVELPRAGLPIALSDAGGQPALLMERAERSLAEHIGGWGLSDFVGLCHDLLDGLAHVAGHGRAHLDVKPTNVLLVTRPEGSAVARLADFGVSSPGAVAGTQTYMAPEQRTGHPELARTDLYSLGATLLHVACGAASTSHRQIALAGERLGSSAIAGWLGRLVQQRPEDRFFSAAEARASLCRCAGDRRPWSAPARAGQALDADATSPVTVALSARPPAPVVDVALAVPARVEIPEKPPTVRGTSARSLATDGIGVWQDRVSPLVGRVAVRDALWKALVQSRREAAVVRLCGAAGAGRHRIAKWLAVTAHEQAGALCATLLVPDCQSDTTVADAMARWLLRVYPRPRHPEAATLASQPDDATVFRNTDARNAALGAWLTEAAERAPTLVVCEDEPPPPLLASWHEMQMPVLWLRIADSGVGTVVDVPPLGEAEVRSLLAERVRLDESLAREIAVRSKGLPGRALELLGTAQSSGSLESTSDGWRLRQGARLPTQTAAPVHPLPGSAPSSLRWVLVLAALGGRLADEHARALPESFALVAADAERWERDGVVFREPGGWLTTLTIDDVAGLDDWPVARSEALALLPHAQPGPMGALRAASLWLDGDETERAVRELVRLAVSGVDALVAAGAFGVLERLDDTPERPEIAVLRARYSLAMGRHDRVTQLLSHVHERKLSTELRALLEEVRVRAALTLGDPESAARCAEEMLGFAEGAAEAELVVRAWVERARVAVIRRRGRPALAAVEQALAAASAATPPRVRFTLSVIRTHALLLEGRAEEAYEAATLAFTTGQGAVEPHALANAANDAGDACRAIGRFDEARSWYERAIELSVDRFPFAAYVHGNLASLDLEQGRRAAAVPRLDRALRRLISAERPRVWWLLRGLQIAALADPALASEWDAAMEDWATRDVHGVAFEECARAGELAALSWSAAADPGRAEAATRFANAHRAALGHTSS